MFHRVDDLAELDGPRFLRLTAQLPRYAGALRAALVEAHRADAPAAGMAPGAREIQDVHELAATVPGIEITGR